MKNISMEKDGILIENDRLRIRVSHAGRITEVSDAKTFENWLKRGTMPAFCRLAFGDDRQAEPVSCRCRDGEITFYYEQGKSVTLAVTTADAYLAFEIVRTENVSSCTIVFAEAEYAYPTPEYEDAADAFGIVGVIMDARTMTKWYPDYMERKTGAMAYEELGYIGAKYALIAGPVGEHPELLKRTAGDIGKGMLPVSVGVGGPWAKTCEPERGSYIITIAGNAEDLKHDEDIYRMMGIDIVDFHQGGFFRQGDFYFKGVSGGTAADFKREVVDKLEEKGIRAGLHSYSALIDYDAQGLLTDPKWQKQLTVTERYTLRADVSETDTALETLETTEHASRDISFLATISEYLLIDEEIVRFSVSDIGDAGFYKVTRGWAGTRPACHGAGAEIRRLGCMYGCLCPVPGSGLFYEVAHRTADAYNEGGFSMIYFDGLEGIEPHIADPALYSCWQNIFINEVLRYTHRPPIAESSRFAPVAYFSRGRAGAWDSPLRSMKATVRLHLQANEVYRRIHLNATLGWLNIYPEMPDSYPANAMMKYVFSDDIDYLGAQALAYDYSYVFQCMEGRLDTVPALRRNLERFLRYDRLRRKRYFSEEVCRTIRKSPYEYCLTELSDGSFGFTEMKYSPKKTVPGSADYKTTGHVNPFSGQSPFIRLEAFAAANGKEMLTVLPRDPEKELSEQMSSMIYPENTLMTGHRFGVRFSVFGNGNPDAAIAVRLTTKTPMCGDWGPLCDYVVRLDFEGWREFSFVDTDNCDYPEFFPEMELRNARCVVIGECVTCAEILCAGDCSGVRMTDVSLCRHENTVMSRPAVTVGKHTLVFCCDLHDGEYIEYTPEGTATLYDSLGNGKPVECAGDKLTVPTGAFDAVLTAAEQTNPSERCCLTFGFRGKFLTND